MSWADNYITQLKAGTTIKFRPRGNSMVGRISSGELCTVEPVAGTDVKKGDIVLCKVRGKQFLHLVTAVRNGQVQISNNTGHVNGWCSYANIYGKCIAVEP